MNWMPRNWSPLALTKVGWRGIQEKPTVTKVAGEQTEPSGFVN